MTIPYTFPMDAEYVIKVRLARDILENIGVFAEDQQLEVSLDGERVQLFTLPGFRPQRQPAAGGRGAAGSDFDDAELRHGSGAGAGEPAAGEAAARRPPAAPAQGRGARPRRA